MQGVAVVATTAMAASMGRKAVETDPQDRDRTEPFAIQARVPQIGRGWLEVEAAAVQPGADVEPTARLLIVETAATKFWTAGDAQSVLNPKVGELVQIAGSIFGMTDQADSITPVESHTAVRWSLTPSPPPWNFPALLNATHNENPRSGRDGREACSVSRRVRRHRARGDLAGDGGKFT